MGAGGPIIMVQKARVNIISLIVNAMLSLAKEPNILKGY